MAHLQTSADVILSVSILIGIWYAAHSFWRWQAISCASSWTSERGLVVRNWSEAVFDMHRTNPCISFFATNHDSELFDVKLRLSMGIFGNYKVDEIAYYCSAEPDSVSK